mmetsp:Transcript_23772/g.22875  ORF Transcript_23772/g.22875 Transcript_23772/m.22875 type:complete len:92 (+) Transcript_23772:175-450(+)
MRINIVIDMMIIYIGKCIGSIDMMYENQYYYRYDDYIHCKSICIGGIDMMMRLPLYESNDHNTRSTNNPHQLMQPAPINTCRKNISFSSTI